MRHSINKRGIPQGAVASIAGGHPFDAQRWIGAGRSWVIAASDRFRGEAQPAGPVRGW